MNTLTLLLRKVLSVALMALMAGPAAAGYSQIIAFGDSLSDTGNLYKLTSFLPTGGLPGDPYYAGRFSDGLLAVEAMAFELDIKVTSYAYGGAQTGLGNQGGVLLLGTGVAGQVALFGEQLDDHAADNKAIYFVWAGPNDFYTSNNMLSSSTAKSAAKNELKNIQNLFDLGARDFFVPLMPDLSTTPAALTGDPAYRAAAKLRTQEYNQYLSEGIQSLVDSTPGLNAIVFDTPGFMQSHVSTLTQEGFNVTEACYNAKTGEVCLDEDKHVFWDSVHPSAATDWILGAAFAQATLPPSVPVPEPDAVLMSLAGLGALVWRGRYLHLRRHG